MKKYELNKIILFVKKNWWIVILIIISISGFSIKTNWFEITKDNTEIPFTK